MAAGLAWTALVAACGWPVVAAAVSALEVPGVVAAVAATVVLVGALVAMLAVEPRRRRRLLAGGVPGVGTVTSVRDTGWSILGRHAIELELAVTTDGRASHRATAREAVSLTTIGQAVPGASVPVMVDPDRPERAAVDWNASQILATARQGQPGWAYLGVFAVALHSRMADRLGLRPGDGLLALVVAAGSPAQHAGVAPGDVLVTASHTPLRRPADLAALVARGQPGQRLVVQSRRGGAMRTTTAILSVAPAGRS